MTQPPLAAAGEIRLAARQGRWVLLATVLGSGMAMLDGTVVNVALPTIGKEFGASLAGLQWTITAYTLTLAGLILLGGSLGDRLGRRRVFVTGVVWFALASALCGLAPVVGVLIAARALQGVGGALLTPGSLAIIQAAFAPEDRARAVGSWSGLGGVAGAVGPFLGGWIIQSAGWRWVFLINLPVAAVVVAVTIRHVPETSDPAAHGRFDVGGAVLAAAALGGITYALIQASGQGGFGGGVLAAAFAGLAAGAAFVLLERARGRAPQRVPPMLPLDVFASRQFSAVNVVTFLVYGALGGMLFLLVLELQLVSGYSPLAAGVALLPSTLAMLLLSARSAALAQRVGPRWLMAAGAATCAAGLLLMVRIGPHAVYLTQVFPAVLIFGLGLAMVVAPLTATVLASAEVRHAGVASGVNNAVARAAGLFAVAALPLAVGLTGPDYQSPAVFESGFRTAMVICAALLAAGALLSAVAIDNNVLRPVRPDHPVPQPECLTCFPVGAPQLDPGRAAGHAGHRPLAATDP
jgi:EmrB/QacA subfamily drug resistance transporter